MQYPNNTSNTSQPNPTNPNPQKSIKPSISGQPKKIKGNNPQGNNRYTNADPLIPYSVRFAHAKMLINEGKKYSEIQLATGLSKPTICNIKNGKIRVNLDLVGTIKKHESAKLVMLSNKILDNVTETDIEKASLLQKTTSYSQLLDKRRLLDGESTENLSIHSTVKSFEDQKENISEQLKSLQEELSKRNHEK